MNGEWTVQSWRGCGSAREYVTTELPSERGDVSDVYVWMEGEPGAAEFPVIFKHRDRPRCMFGTRFGMQELDISNDRTVLVSANVNEMIDAADMGLPTDC